MEDQSQCVRLKKVKKIILFLVSLLFLVLISPQKALAGCDPHVYDLSAKPVSVVGSNGAFGTTKVTCPANTCETGETSECSIFSISGIVNCRLFCAPKGVTSQDPTCPPGSIAYPACSSPFSIGCAPQVCCTATTSWNPLDCSPKVHPENIVDKNYCSAGGQLKYDNNPDSPSYKKCVYVAESLWSVTYNCGPEITIKNPDGTELKRSSGIGTAIGCVPTDNLADFLKFILKFAFFASGGIIVLMVIATGYTIITSQGNPEKLQGAKENIVALLSGFALIVFSLILLQIIGANVLGLPTF